MLSAARRVVRPPCRRVAVHGKKKKKGGDVGVDVGAGDGSGPAAEPAKKLTPKERRALAKAQKEAEQQARLDAVAAAAEAKKKPCDDVEVRRPPPSRPAQGSDGVPRPWRRTSVVHPHRRATPRNAKSAQRAPVSVRGRW